MKKGFMQCLMAATLLSSSSIYAQEGLSQTYEFYPNQSTEVENPLCWTLDTQCEITTPDMQDSLTGTMIKKNGSINGVKLNQGESLTVIVHKGDQLHIRADYRAKMLITNHGYSLVKAE